MQHVAMRVSDARAGWARVARQRPTLTYSGPVPARTSCEFLSLVGTRCPPEGLVLDVGCGRAAFRDPVQGMGRRYMGTDIGGEAPDFLSDAHALPVKSGVADVVLMYGVLQALAHPFAAVREVARVLKPGGLWLSTSDPGAVFVDSHFHITPWGLMDITANTGLCVESAWVNKDVLMYAGTNPGYPRTIRFLLRLLSRVARARVLTPRRLLRGQARDPFMTAGSYSFAAVKRA